MNISLALVSALFFANCAFAADYDGKSTIPTGAQSAAESAKNAKKDGLQEVVIVYKTHFDIGYTARASEVVHEYRTEMADRLLDAIAQNASQPKEKQFVWTLSGWPMKQILWEGQTPERRTAIEKAIRDGNIAIHAYPFSTHTEIAEPEDLVRGLNISSTLARKYGQPLSTAVKMTDVPGQSWIFPTLLTHAGIKFYHMGGPVVNKVFNLPPMFWWEGPDGSRLLTLYNNKYGTSSMPPANWPYKSWVYISMTGDNQGPPPPNVVAGDLAFYKSRGINARVGKLDDFADLILKEDLSKLPVVRSDIPDPWIHGPMSMPEAAKIARNSRLNIFALDAITTLEKCWGIHRPDYCAAVAEAYEQSALYAEHTWGLANQHYVKTPYGADWDKLWAAGLPANYRKMTDAWDDHANYAKNVDRLTALPCLEAVSTLCDQVNVPGPRITVFNPLPWKRDGEVCVNAFLFPHGNALKPVDGGDAIPYAIEGPTVETPDRIRRFIAKDIPPLGYRTYRVVREKLPDPGLVADEKSCTLESPYFKAVLDPKAGRIVSLIDKRTNRELVDPAAPQGFGSYFYERFSWQQLEDWMNASLYRQYWSHRFCFTAYDMPKNVPYAAAQTANMTLTMKKTAIDVSAVMTGTLPGPGQPQQIAIRLTLPAAMPVADLTVDWIKQPDSWPEAAWICLPFKVGNPKFRLGKLGGDLDPVKDITVNEANYYNSWVNTGVCVYDGTTGAGVGVCPIDSPMVSLGVPGEYKFKTRYEPTLPYVYINLYNNHWRTNFAAWIGDGRRMSSKVRLWVFDQFNSESALLSPAMEARVPLAVSRSVCHPGSLPPTQSGIALSRKGVLVTAFGPNPDGDGTVLRVWEQAGTFGDLTVTLPGAFTLATPVNLRGEKLGEPLKITDGKFSFNLKAYSPASFILHPEFKAQTASAVQNGAPFIQSLRAGKKITIVTMGTSLTGGAWRWPDVMMKDWLNKEFPGQVTLFNEGVGASSSGVGPGNNPKLSGLGKLPAVLAHKPDVVFIEFTTNDSYLPHKISLEDSKKNLNTIIDGILAANPKTEIILQTMNSVKDQRGGVANASNRPKLAEYAQGYRDVAKARGLLIVDHYPNWEKLMRENPDRFDQLIPDRIHPQLPGYREILLPELKKTLGNGVNSVNCTLSDEKTRAASRNQHGVDGRR